ncbi:unnamed protein product, partial [Discosporangium mesarthrocarpum]
MCLSSPPPPLSPSLCICMYVRARVCSCIRLLLAFLFRVNLCSADNKMTTENLGIVFAPNLLRAPNATEISVMDLQV